MQKVLVIEDEAQIRENIREILELTGFEVIAAEDGKTGLKLAKGNTPDLILCDIMMPELDGYEVLDALRQDQRTALIPLIFLTAKVERFDQRRGMDLGADDYLTKPFEPDELLSAIASRFQRQATVTQQITKERQKNRKIRYEMYQNQRKLQESQKQEEIKTDLLNKLAQDLRNPLSNINMAIRMLVHASSDEERDRYIQILQQECEREIKLLNEVEQLQTLLTPENTELLQKYRIIQQ
jgi:two-component system, OmpR family, alkaline phosphatase synthesis response regulator PhoP